MQSLKEQRGGKWKDSRKLLERVVNVSSITNDSSKARVAHKYWGIQIRMSNGSLTLPPSYDWNIYENTQGHAILKLI